MKLTIAVPGLLLCVRLFGADQWVDCDRRPALAEALERAIPGETLHITGICSGPIVITARNLTLEGPASISGNGKDVITVNGPARVTLKNLDVHGGNNGIVGASGAQLTILSTTVHDNAVDGIFLSANSSANISGGSTMTNGLNGLHAEGDSAIVLSGSYHADKNGVFGINVNGASSLTFTQANLTASQNTLGIQIGTSASAFVSDPVTVLTVNNNLTTGLTIVSGAHMVAFGGTITASGNGVHGISVDSKAGLDLDAAAAVTSNGNGQDGVHVEETSVLTMFNTTAFSGAPGTTMLTTQNNGLNGISVLTGSNLTVIHQASITSTQNAQSGIQADNGSSLTLIQSTVNHNLRPHSDVALSFGSRGDITTSNIGSVSCDATVLLRGTTGAVCPSH